MVSTHLKNISQIGSFPQVGLKIKNVWNHHLVLVWGSVSFPLIPLATSVLLVLPVTEACRHLFHPCQQSLWCNRHGGSDQQRCNGCGTPTKLQAIVAISSTRGNIKTCWWFPTPYEKYSPKWESSHFGEKKKCLKTPPKCENLNWRECT